MTIIARAAATLWLLGVLAIGQSAQAAEVKFLGGAGFKSVMPELAARFEKANAHKITATWDATGGIQRRLTAGEVFDVVFVGPDVVDKFIHEGKLVAGTKVDVARAGLGVAVLAGAPKPDVSSPEKFKQALLNAKSVGYAAQGMSGAHFVKLLDRLKIADQMKPKVKPLPVADIFKSVTSGESEMVVFLKPAIVADHSVALAGALPEELQAYIALSTGLLTAAPQPDAGRAFIAFLKSDEVTKIIRASGW